MPRSSQGILDHTDQLAEQFENFDPDSAVEIPVEEYLLRRAVIARARSEQQLLEAVAKARSAGVSWQKIRTLLGTSAQAAQRRYNAALENHLTTRQIGDEERLPTASTPQLSCPSGGRAAFHRPTAATRRRSASEIEGADPLVLRTGVVPATVPVCSLLAGRIGD